MPRHSDYAKSTWAILTLLSLIGTVLAPRRSPAAVPNAS